MAAKLVEDFACGMSEGLVGRIVVEVQFERFEQEIGCLDPGIGMLQFAAAGAEVAGDGDQVMGRVMGRVFVVTALCRLAPQIQSMFYDEEIARESGVDREALPLGWMSAVTEQSLAQRPMRQPVEQLGAFDGLRAEQDTGEALGGVANRRASQLASTDSPGWDVGSFQCGAETIVGRCALLMQDGDAVKGGAVVCEFEDASGDFVGLSRRVADAEVVVWSDIGRRKLGT